MSNVDANKKVVKVYFNDLRDYEEKNLDDSLLKLIENQLNINQGEYVVISNNNVEPNFNSNKIINLDDQSEE